MAKTIMISNAVYDELKRRKGIKSFSELIGCLMDKRDDKTAGNLLKFAGMFKGDVEFEKAMIEARKGWDKWNKRYA